MPFRNLTPRKVNFLWTLGMMACLSIICSAISQEMGQIQARADRLAAQVERQAVKAEARRVAAAPVTDWIDYRSATQVDGPTPPKGEIVMQSDIRVSRPTRVRYDNVVRCKPVDGGPERVVSATTATIAYDTPTSIGYPPDATLPDTYRRRDGQWVYQSPAPEFEADCIMTITPCALIGGGVEKCQTAESGPIEIRVANAP